MANIPPSLNLKAAPFEASSITSAAAAAASAANKDRRMQSAEHLVLDLCNPDLRENALLELSKKRELFQDLAPLLWNSFGTVAALLQEIVSIYPVLSPPNLTPAQSNRVCNALALLQCVASHPDTRMLFLNAHIPLYLYPFLNTTSKSRPFEYLRLTSLGVIGALVKVDDTEVISFLLSTEIIPLCLRTMEMGSELSKTVATFIVQKILLDDVGLEYICTTAERFFAVGRVLANMVAALADQPSSRLLKHIIRCYLRLSDNPRACDALRNCLPDMLRDATFSSCLRLMIQQREGGYSNCFTTCKGLALSPCKPEVGLII
ncbi:CCR4-NOT transcription complex subunit 9 [Castilleja foliolosa]|uniref:CCR4-NOT transcription complex subunit 9 n=1 Tax=Castilleja foliolosa TaxID=1961234 RepID=A0ABD3DR62_9LAMI